MKITVFSDYICPFCYIGIETLRQVQAAVPPFTLEWKGFQIHPEYPAAGVPIERRIAQYGQERYAAVWRNILSLAEGIGLEMHPPAVLTNSLLALEATEYARDQGKETAFSTAVYQAYFRRSQNIGDIDVLLSLAEQTDLNPAEVQDHLKAGTYAVRIQDSQQEARACGVSGVPTFIVGSAQIIGAQSPEVFVSMLKRVAERGLAQ